MSHQITIPLYTTYSLTHCGAASPYKAYNAYVDRNDVCYIGTLNRSYRYLKYPAGNTYKWAYCHCEDVLPSICTEKIFAKSSATTYKYPGGGTYGSVTADDIIYKCGEKDGYSAVIYPTSSGFKPGFIPNNVYNAYIAHNPISCIDSITSNAVGKITVYGWALDLDSYAAFVECHIYLGGPAGSGAWCTSLGGANSYRPDVNNVYYAGSYHGLLWDAKRIYTVRKSRMKNTRRPTMKA